MANRQINCIGDSEVVAFAIPARGAQADARRKLRRLKSELLAEVFGIAHMLHPSDDHPINRLLNSDVGHGDIRCRAMSVSFIGREPDHIARKDFFNSAAFTLHAPLS
ncbi:hypothetical protein ACSBLW_07375 [Thioclava sp. FR2]|uniref:hypothetical protein n=1 Tax=Thioclava sp. FR2 TaxID=3445780 RepID=UPI003EBB6065